MDAFLSLFLGMGLSSMFFDNWSQNFDIIGSLPEEVAVIILRKLDPKSLVTAIRVCRKWLRIVRSDKILRKTVRDELIRQRKEKMRREMFFSASVKASFSFGPFSGSKESKRRFEVSVNPVAKTSKKRKATWDCPPAQIRKLR